MKKYIWISAVGVIVIVGAFVGGMQYGKHGTQTPFAAGMDQRFGGPNGQMGAGRGALGSVVTGDIISKDATSITIQTLDGSSKIVFLSSTTEISKFTGGSVADLAVGKTVMINGKTGSDGSVTAQTIQLRPNMPTPSPAAR
jgi:hypothetical protein